MNIEELVQFMFDNGVKGTDTNDEVVKEMI
jgi:hypothetical protein